MKTTSAYKEHKRITPGRKQCHTTAKFSHTVGVKNKKRQIQKYN